MPSRSVIASILLPIAVLAGETRAGEPFRLRLSTELLLERAADGANFVSARRASGKPGGQTALEGDVELRRLGIVVRADRATYDPDTDTVSAEGRVRVSQRGSLFEGERLQLRLDRSEGYFLAPEYQFPFYGGRGRADRIEFAGRGLARLYNGSYTTCETDDPDWEIRAERLDLDQNEGEGRARGASLYLGGMRVFAMPVAYFSISDERKTGLLTPSFYLSDQTGAEAVLPFYWNIAPNRDMTLYPRLMARRGLQLGAWFRYLEPSMFGDAKLELTPRDAVTGTTRYFYSTEHAFRDWAGWSGGLRLRGVSDDDYFVNYSRSILTSSERSLPRELYVSRVAGDWTTVVALRTYQNILEARADPPYDELPRVTVHNDLRDLAGFDISAVFDLARFDIADRAQPTGWRLVANPSVSLPLLRAGYFLVPRLSVHASSYQLDRSVGLPRTLWRVVPTASFDAGLIFERDMQVLGERFTQTLEPRLFYVRTPYRDQSDFPDFDSNVADFGFVRMFSENTFTGSDRIADANQLTAAVFSRLIEPSTGVERARFALGQRTYFEPQRVTLAGVSPITDRRSDLLAGMAMQLTRSTAIDTLLQYSVRDREVPRLNFSWQYRPQDNRVVNFSYRYQRGIINQFDTSWQWPLAARWNWLGRLNYSFLGSTDPATGAELEQPGMVQAIAGFEYDACCWRLRVVGQRYITSTRDTNTALFLQLELKGVGRIGNDPSDILRRGIRGYRLPSDRPEIPSTYFGYE
ncbi:MAG: LPS-assembly protein LptD [Burkholderiales bacterium]|nr:MAG: LPS-assembly protein LptD [Burkholderiales bacterium]